LLLLSQLFYTGFSLKDWNKWKIVESQYMSSSEYE
jgi:hypothetical protein